MFMFVYFEGHLLNFKVYPILIVPVNMNKDKLLKIHFCVQCFTFYRTRTIKMSL